MILSFPLVIKVSRICNAASLWSSKSFTSKNASSILPNHGILMVIDFEVKGGIVTFSSTVKKDFLFWSFFLNLLIILCFLILMVDKNVFTSVGIWEVEVV